MSKKSIYNDLHLELYSTLHINKSMVVVLIQECKSFPKPVPYVKIKRKHILFIVVVIQKFYKKLFIISENYIIWQYCSDTLEPATHFYYIHLYYSFK